MRKINGYRIVRTTSQFAANTHDFGGDCYSLEPFGLQTDREKGFDEPVTFIIPDGCEVVEGDAGLLVRTEKGFDFGLLELEGSRIQEGHHA